MTKHLSLVPAAILLSLILVGCNKKADPASADASAPAASASAPAGPVAKVNGKIIPGDLADFIFKEQVEPGTPMTEELSKNIREHLIQREILLQAARASGFEKQPDVRQRLQFQQDDFMVQAYIKNWGEQNKPTDADLQAYYDKKIAEVGATEYKARHILLETEEEAKAVIEKLDKKAKFADLAKASKDPGSKDNGGDLGWARPATFVPEFAAALQALEKGKYTTAPVKSQFGYHVIQLDDSRQADNPKLEDVKDQLLQVLEQENLKKFVDDLRAKAKIE